MRIQHNIMAMNAYRNYNNNTSALSKNLEKLSSGYKINRAGDDAAGLAISEKMRAQITGLQTAQKNVKDGISLVKTGEGAMQEVQDMLNRMVELATQSANGTYDNEVDRDNLQKEVDQLKTEIDRIADSANFNGIKLLDGSLAETKVDLTSATIGGVDGTITNVAATGAKSDITVAAAGTTGDHKLTVEYATADGSLKKVELTYNVKNNTGANDQATAIRDAISKNAELSAIFDVGGTAAKVELTSKVTGEKGAKVVSMSSDDNGVITATNAAVTAGTNAKTTVDNIAGVKANDSITLNGKTYEFVNKAGDKTSIDGATAVVLGKDADATAAALNAALDGTGISVKNAGGNFMFTADQNGAGLTLQIGDTSDDYNQMTVKIGDVHVQALGLNGVSVASQDAAQAAVKSIKDAINTVSSIRGTLGATQNRLEHTQNNLSVMTENIQDAESTIRDTDVADEMMAYTKNNILVQSAQAMLAQANQVPQGVLQLLQ